MDREFVTLHRPRKLRPGPRLLFLRHSRPQVQQRSHPRILRSTLLLCPVLRLLTSRLCLPLLMRAMMAVTAATRAMAVFATRCKVDTRANAQTSTGARKAVVHLTLLTDAFSRRLALPATPLLSPPRRRPYHPLSSPPSTLRCTRLQLRLRFQLLLPLLYRQAARLTLPLLHRRTPLATMA